MSRRKMNWLFVVPLLFVLLLAVTVVRSWRRPPLGPVEGRLRNCPASPNCVCSQQHPPDDTEHAIAPLAVTGDADAAWTRLTEMLRRRPQAQIVTETADYLHVEFATPWLRFVDDVEFLRDDAAQVIQVRSASRVGRSDFGVNRRRIERLRQEFVQ